MIPLTMRRIFLLLALLLAASPVFAEEVRYVIDGDTLILKNNQRVRMIGVDAPEIAHRRYGKKKGETFGDQSRRYLEGLVERKDVVLKDGQEPFDRFGRRLAYVYLLDGTFVNLKMVEEGYAEAYRKFPFEFKEEFLDAEDAARREKKGMWSGETSKPMAEFFARLIEDLR